jgi:hypothetical protein
VTALCGVAALWSVTSGANDESRMNPSGTQTATLRTAAGAAAAEGARGAARSRPTAEEPLANAATTAPPDVLSGSRRPGQNPKSTPLRRPGSDAPGGRTSASGPGGSGTAPYREPATSPAASPGALSNPAQPADVRAGGGDSSSGPVSSRSGRGSGSPGDVTGSVPDAGGAKAALRAGVSPPALPAAGQHRLIASPATDIATARSRAEAAFVNQEIPPHQRPVVRRYFAALSTRPN